MCNRLSLCIGTIVLIAGTYSPAQEPKRIDFAHDIVPIIKARCAECHTNGKYKGSLSLDTREAILAAKVVIPGKSADSELFKRITSEDEQLRMPLKGKPLTAEEIARIKTWIDQGLPWDPGFTFQVSTYAAPLKLRKVTVPAAQNGLNHPIDRILAAYYAANKVTPPALLDDIGFMRRLYLDLIGLLPAPAEVEAFLSSTSPGKRDRLIRQALAEKRAYADHWLTFWNDLLRNDYRGTGYIDGGRKQITNWLYQSLLDNKPYDRFVRELIIPSAESEGFINGIQWRGRVNASQVREVQFSQNVSQVFFGANVKCASCHDSFIDNWKLEDAYGLAAVIAEKPLEIHRCDKATGKIARPKFLWPELGTIDPTLPRAKRLEQLADLMIHPDNGRFSRTIVNRIWQRLFGRGIVHPVDVMANKPWSEDLLDYLAAYLIDQGYDLKKLMEHIVSSRTYQSRPVAVSEDNSADAYVFRGPELKRMTAEQFLDAIYQITHAGPTKLAAPIKPPVDKGIPAERQFIRAALVNSDALMRSLGRPNREQVVTTRPDILTTLQALDLSNGQILLDLLARGAANLLKENGSSSLDRLVESIYLRSLSRRPTADELVIARDIVGSPATPETVADLLWVIVMLPEFQLIR